MRLRVTVRAKRARAAGCPQRFARCVAMWCDAQRRVVERCDAPRRVAYRDVDKSYASHRLPKTWRGREATSRQRCCRIVFIFVSDSMSRHHYRRCKRSCRVPQTVLAPTPAHSTRMRIAKEEVTFARRRSMIGRLPTKSTLYSRGCWRRDASQSEHLHHQYVRI
jgi:hypothetical protein